MSYNSLSKCPNCHANELIQLDNGNYQCRACDQIFSAGQIEGETASAATIANVVSAAIRDIDSPDSALLYLDTFFDAFDWKAYGQTPDIYVEDLRVMVEKNKVKNPGNPNTWQLEAASIIFPVEKKIEAIAEIASAIIDKYQGDVSDVIDEFASYNNLAGAIDAAREEIERTLNADVANMKRFGGDEKQTAAVEAKVKAVLAAIADIAPVAEVEDIPAFKAYAENNKKKLIKDYSAKGIDAEVYYKSGVENFKAHNYRQAIAFFEKIADYADSSKYMNRMNVWFEFKDIVEIGGKLFKTAPHKPQALASVAALASKGGCGKKKEEAPAPEAQPDAQPEVDYSCVDLYEIINAAPAPTALITGISNLICVYGDKIYYIKKHKQLCVFSISENIETVLDETKAKYVIYRGEQIDDPDDMLNEIIYVKKGKLCVRKLLESETFKPGCNPIGRKDREAEFYKSQQNLYSLSTISLSTSAVVTEIEKMVSCICLRDVVFYNVSEVVFEDAKHHKTYENKAKFYNFATKKTEVLFEKNCKIIGVTGTKVVYVTWGPNCINIQIHAIDYITREDRMLEDNAYQFISFAGDKVLFTVGNQKRASLFSIELNGENRTEILPTFSKDSWGSIIVVGHWIYMRRGSTMLKVSLDTKDKIFIATDIKEVIQITGNYLYYISTNDSFRVVRLDGKNNLFIASGLKADDVCIGETAVYYKRWEYVTPSHSRSNYSLYRMDPDGHNIKKLMFDIDLMKDKNRNVADGELYIYKEEYRSFKITSADVSTVESFLIRTYLSLNKKTGETKDLLILGLPNPDNYHTMEKEGCKLFQKKHDDTVTIEEIIPEIDYGQFEDANVAAVTLTAMKQDMKEKGVLGMVKGIFSNIVNKIKGIFKK